MQIPIPDYAKEFFEEHGDHVWRPNSNTLVFEDGAECVESDGHFAWMTTTIKDEHLIAKNIMEFYAIKLNDAVHAFDQYKLYLNEIARSAKVQRNPALLPDRSICTPKLRKLQSEVRKLKKGYDIAAAEFSKWDRSSNHTADAYAGIQADEFWNSVNSYTI